MPDLRLPTARTADPDLSARTAGLWDPTLATAPGQPQDPQPGDLQPGDPGPADLHRGDPVPGDPPGGDSPCPSGPAAAHRAGPGDARSTRSSARAVDLDRAPAGWPPSCAPGCWTPGWPGRRCRWTSGTASQIPAAIRRAVILRDQHAGRAYGYFL